MHRCMVDVFVVGNHEGVGVMGDGIFLSRDEGTKGRGRRGTFS